WRVGSYAGNRSENDESERLRTSSGAPLAALAGRVANASRRSADNGTEAAFVHRAKCRGTQSRDPHRAVGVSEALDAHDDQRIATALLHSLRREASDDRDQPVDPPAE